MAVGGNKWARARVISKAIDKGTPSVEPLPNNVGWGPRQSIHVVHDKNSARLPKLYFPERWDAIHEGAPGLRNLRIMFNYIIKDKNEFMRRFNKYGFGTAVGVPTAATINNYDNGK